jgi:hypothetical protein
MVAQPLLESLVDTGHTPLSRAPSTRDITPHTSNQRSQTPSHPTILNKNVPQGQVPVQAVREVDGMRFHMDSDSLRVISLRSNLFLVLRGYT